MRRRIHASGNVLIERQATHCYFAKEGGREGGRELGREGDGARDGERGIERWIERTRVHGRRQRWREIWRERGEMDREDACSREERGLERERGERDDMETEDSCAREERARLAHTHMDKILEE